MTMNWIGWLCLWVLWDVGFIWGWYIGYNKGYYKARRIYGQERSEQ